MRAILLVTVAALVAGCGGDDGGNNPPIDASPVDVGPDAMPREVITESVPLVVNEVVEAIMVGGPDDIAHVRMTADGEPIDWNLHSHLDGGTQVVTQELGVPSVDFVFVPDVDAEWFLLIRNKGQVDITVSLTVDLFGDMTWQGFQ